MNDLARRLELALDASGIGIWEHNLARSVVHWDARMHGLYSTGLPEGDASDSVWQSRIHPEDFGRAESDFAAALASQGRYDSQFRVIWPNGQIRHLRSRAHYYVNEDKEPCFIGAEWDVTDEVSSHAQIQYAMDHDYLTGLPNRRILDAWLDDPAHAANAAVFRLDFDGFKEFNNASGPAAGDEFLRRFATQLKTCLPAGAMAARTGGDEFTVVMQEPGPDASLLALGAKIVEASRLPLLHPRQALLSASAGIARTGDGDVAQDLMTASDVALAEAKRRGGGAVVLCSPLLWKMMQDKRRLLEELKQAIRIREIVPYYQVQVDASTREVVGVEALARWLHPVEGLLAPDRFLPLAEEAGLLADIDEAVMEGALQDQKAWAAAGLQQLHMSLNLSCQRLLDPNLLSAVQSAGANAGKLSFELVETIFLDDASEAVRTQIEALRALQCGIEIDDFGSGHASLLGLLKINPDRMKIDRNLIGQVIGSPVRRQVIKSIVDIASALEIVVVAEGVETEEQAAILCALGCSVLQGYYFGRPVPASAIERLLSFGVPLQVTQNHP
jgi:diguanylate cyclase (GGDEF)-like protein